MSLLSNILGFWIKIIASKNNRLESSNWSVGSPINQRSFDRQTDVENPIAWTKWEYLNINTEANFWTAIYKICFKSIQDNKFIWFQYRIINNILDTNYYLNKVKIQNYNKCQLCNDSPETISHLFSQCNKVLELWNNVKQWVTNRTSIYLELNDTTKILGYTTYDENFWAINFILIVTRFYIYWSSKKKLYLNIFHLQKTN